MVRLAREASGLCGASVGMVSLMEAEEEWVVACVGTEADRVPRLHSFCAHTILEPEGLVVPDASKDPRFATNPFVLDRHHLRFYAGAPMFDATGLPLGAVCVAHAKPQEVSTLCLETLRHLADVASAVLETRLLFADSYRRILPDRRFPATRARLDALLLTLIQPHPSRE